MYKAYATKYRSTKKKIIAKYRVGKDFGIHYSVKNGDKKIRLFYNKGFKCKKNNKRYFCRHYFIIYISYQQYKPGG